MLVLGRIVLDLIGYVAAVLAASLTAHILLLPQIGLFASQDREFATAVMLFTVPLTAAVLAAAAFLPACVAILVAEGAALTGWLYHAACGGIIGLVGVFGYRNGLLVDFLAVVASRRLLPEGAPLESSGLMGIAVAAGIVGGFAYWLIAGRSSGSWRGRPVTSPGP